MARRRQTKRATEIPRPEDLLPGALGRAFRVFDLIPTMEELVARRWPRREEEPRGLMLLLFPTPPVRTEALYRAHVEELLARVPPNGSVWTTQDWRSLSTLTRAEVVGLLSEASLRHPLAHHEALVYEMLFRECCPTLASRLEPGDVLSAATVAEVRRTVDEWLACESPERVETVRQLRSEAA